LQDPNTSNPPPDVTIVDYNTFVEQVRASNILSVTIQGKEITGTLEHTLQGQTCSTPPATQTYDPFTGMQLWLSAPTPSTCTIFTYLPVQGDFALMPLLLSQGVVVNTRPAKKSSTWQDFLWLLVPIVLLLIVINRPPGRINFRWM
jgi:ATP-dependent Zn protease